MSSSRTRERSRAASAAQHVVAGAVAVAVVERLEAVGVEEDDRELLVVAARAAQQRVQLADGVAPVRDAGELVVVRHRLEVVLAREQLLLHLLRAPCGAHPGDDLGRRRVLAEHVVGAVLERVEGRRNVARLADDDHRDAEEVGVALDLGDRAAEGGVQEQHVGALRARGAEDLVARPGLGDDRADSFEDLAHRFASALRRVRDEHPRPRAASRPWSLRP